MKLFEQNKTIKQFIIIAGIIIILSLIYFLIIFLDAKRHESILEKGGEKNSINEIFVPISPQSINEEESDNIFTPSNEGVNNLESSQDTIEDFFTPIQ